jgi:hypothetical protein
MDALVGPATPLGKRVDVRLLMRPLSPAAARTLLPRLRPEEFLEAYAACGGYPLHLRRWDQDATTEENLIELALTPGGLLLEDAPAILREAVPDLLGYQRILAAVGRGITRYSEILTAVDQRIERPIDALLRAHVLRRALPVGVPPTTRVTEYEIADTYLAFWFAVLAPAIPEIEAGDAGGVLRGAQPRWQRHLADVFKFVARMHARALVARGELPGDLVVGRWWTTERDPVSVEVLGLQGSRAYLVGGARWRSDAPLGVTEVVELRRLLHYVPRPVETPVLALWGRRGVSPDVSRAGVHGFDLAAAVGE